MSKKYNVGIVGATGMVGQRFATLLENHPWFNVVCLAASSRSAGKTYEEAVGKKWCMDKPIPENMKNIVVMDATNDIDKITSQVDFVFCAVDMKKDEIKALEEEYAKHECPVVSNNSAHRFTSDVPMVVPELNAEHINIIPSQRNLVQSEDLLQLNLIAHFSHMFRLFSLLKISSQLRKFLYVLIRQFPVQVKHLKLGLK